MKNSFLIVALVTLCLLSACDKETIDEQQQVQSIDEEIVDLESTLAKIHGGICYYYVKRGLKISGRCYSGFPSICQIYRICIPDIIFDPCYIIPCWIDILDPWIIYEKINPREFLSFRDKLELKINPEEQAVPFALNEAVAGLQFYQQEGFFKGNTLVLEEAMILDAETSRELGLHGNVVQPGRYPVIANEENGTFNAILAVEKGFER
ncbi:hypothetical protein [Aquimarina brevivitae]|uniref:Lipoprotein n=1 Tax=Aquimarina brevivitae TaxID=323412 RepID=A0A4Q7PFG4_9FLAO|nr:hypothetical protein [Aquimarina brevivitae]RZS99201.1 hypothetical protein EV197_0410 [Aquimarina brevivitae]